MVLDQLRSVSQGNRLQELFCLRNKTRPATSGNTGCLSPPRWQPPPRVAVSPAGTRGRKPGTPAIEQPAAQPAASPEGAPSGQESTRYWPRELRSCQRKGVGELRPCIFPCIEKHRIPCLGVSGVLLPAVIFSSDSLSVAANS